MHVTLELATGARLVTAHREIPVSVTLGYDSADPLAVRLRFPEHITADGKEATWVFARSLLAEGLAAGGGIGNVRIRPQGPTHTLVQLFTPQGVAVLRFDTRVLRRFLVRTHSVVAPAKEAVTVDLEHGLATLFGGRA
ncbi:SsgA family sporulation/cell division regulator [Streptomyces sp. Da 82-17]|uniref:SsgA family sporulation/cell division regulator n=1 Tax=Streptomyces sp. Da 82-17 TaxID=3377116 RepID=UPI0038D40DB2